MIMGASLNSGIIELLGVWCTDERSKQYNGPSHPPYLINTLNYVDLCGNYIFSTIKS